MKSILAAGLIAACLAGCCADRRHVMQPSVSEESFGKLKDGADVRIFTLRNPHGVTVRIMTLGATITEISAPDRNGHFANIILGRDTLNAYTDGSFHFPAQTIGRVANRIANAQFTLDGAHYTLQPNSGPHLLHGGKTGFATRVWNGRALQSPDGPAVEMTYTSKDGEEGFPGTLTATVRFTLTDANELRLDFSAIADKATPVNLTNHVYFNLTGRGEQSSVLDHDLAISAGRYVVTDDALIPTGELAGVKGTPVDFTTPHKIGERIEQVRGKTYDHCFVLDNAGKLILAARLKDPTTGRVLEVQTDQSGLQIYTVNGAQHPAIALETQHFPDSVNHANFPSTILRPGEVFHSTTIFTMKAE